jgi:3-hydroxyisobutyrate dehydrogenase
MTFRLAIQAATRIGWIGTGVMGSSLCGHLLQAGYRITLQGRTKAKTNPLLDLSATWAENPRAVTVRAGGSVSEEAARPKRTRPA